MVKTARQLFFPLILTIILPLMPGCATRSKNISASYVSPIEYSHLDCDQIRRELVRVNRRLTDISGKQNKEATKDAVALGVGLVVFWPALFFMMSSGEKEEIARLKGKYEALETIAIEKRCGFSDELIEAQQQRSEMKRKSLDKKTPAGTEGN